MAGKNNITCKQMTLLTFVDQTGLATITLATALAKEVGHDGWLSVLITGVLSVILGVLIVTLLKRYVYKSILDINKFIFGNLFGTLFNIVLTIYLTLAASLSIRLFLVFLKITILSNTPQFIIGPLVMLPSIYLLSCGLKYVVRFKYISVTVYVVTTIYLILISKYYRLSFVMPVGEAGIRNILSSVKTSYLTFMGLELIAFLFPEITDKKNLMKWHIVTIVSSSLFTSIIVFTSTILFGGDFLKIQTLPLFNLARVYKAPIFERVDLYLIALWFVVMGCSMRAYMFTAYYSLGKVFKLKDNTTVVILFFIIITILSRIPKDINEVFMYRQLICIIGLGIALYFVLCLCLSFLRRKGVKADETV